MNSNSREMTVEERLVQQLKTKGLAELLGGDEDALTKLVERAVREALYQPRRIADGSYHTKEIDSPVVEAARAVAMKAAAKLIETEVARLMTEPEFVDQLGKALATALPEAIRGFYAGMLSSFAEQQSVQTISRLSEMVRNGFRIGG